MSRERTPSFVTEIPLRLNPVQKRTLSVRLDCARQVYNACLGEAPQGLSPVERSL
jgi:hypothetical protein